MKNIYFKLGFLLSFAVPSVSWPSDDDQIPHAQEPDAHDQNGKRKAPGSAQTLASPNAAGRSAPGRRPRPMTNAPGGPQDSGRAPGLGAPGKPGGPGGPGGPGSPEGPMGLIRGNENNP